MPDDFGFFVGIDWATEFHQVCIVDPAGQAVAERTVEHSGPGLTQFVAWLTEFAAGTPARIAVAIEIPRGAIVESLVERQFPVFSLNPKQLDRFRDRHTVAGAKDDSRDAFVLGDSLRTDMPLFKRVQLDDPLIIRLRELSRLEDDLRDEGNRAVNQLREQLHRYYPQMLQLSPAANDRWLWDLLEMAPLPAQGSQLTRSRVDKLLRRHRIRRLGADQVLAALRTPALPLAPGSADAASEHALLLLPRLRLIHQQRKHVTARIQDLLDDLASADNPNEHRDVELLLSLPGVGRVVAATMLAEAPQALAERDYNALRSYGGIAPVTRRSGKKKVILMRHACNCRLRNALYHWSRVSIQCDVHSREHYTQLRQRGHSHGRALRGVADRWLAVLIAMLKTNTLYDPARRTAACTAAAVA